MRTQAPSRRLLAGALVLLLWHVVACAPRLGRPPELDAGGRAARYRALLAERRESGVAVSGDLVLWIESRGEGRLPGAQADLVLVAPDRLRLRVASAFGTALDLGVRGDSLLAWVPSWKTGLRLGSARESLGLREPGGLAYRALSATWEPPGEAWSRAAWDGSVLVVAWWEGGDSLALGVGGDGLPAWVSIGRPGSLTVGARYRAWDRTTGVRWPSHLVFEDDRHGLRVVCKATNLRFRSRADTARLAVRVPEDAARLTLGQLRWVLGRLGVY